MLAAEKRLSKAYYDAKDEAKRVAVNQERNLIIGQMLEEKQRYTQEPKKPRLNTTDTMEE
jgi:hypothetical protein